MMSVFWLFNFLWWWYFTTQIRDKYRSLVAGVVGGGAVGWGLPPASLSPLKVSINIGKPTTRLARESTGIHRNNTHKTANRLMVTIHSQSVPEILSLYRMTKFDFPPYFLKGLMHSFPTVYNTLGSKVDGLARKGHFLQKNRMSLSS